MTVKYRAETVRCWRMINLCNRHEDVLGECWYFDEAVLAEVVWDWIKLSLDQMEPEDPRVYAKFEAMKEDPMATMSAFGKYRRSWSISNKIYKHRPSSRIELAEVEMPIGYPVWHYEDYAWPQIGERE